MSPEQNCSPNGYGKSTDLFALGVTMVTLLTGRNPFSRRGPRPGRVPEMAGANMALLESRAAATGGGGGGGRSTSRLKQQNANPLEDSQNRQSGQAGGSSQTAEDRRRVEAAREDAAERLYADTLDEYKYCWEEFVAHWPADSPVSAECLELLSRLLDVDPNTRIGHTKGCEELQSHPWFSTIDWAKLFARHITPPYIPSQDFVNADYLESTSIGMATSGQQVKKSDAAAMERANDRFQGFEFVNPTIFQEEVIATLHDKLELIHGGK